VCSSTENSFRNDSTSFNVAAPVIIADQQAIRLKGPWQYHAGDLTTDQSVTGINGEVYRELISLDKARSIWKLLDGDAGPLSIDEALRHFKTPDDLTIELVAGEPEVRQPL
jgi:hypothetical protein